MDYALTPTGLFIPNEGKVLAAEIKRTNKLPGWLWTLYRLDRALALKVLPPFAFAAGFVPDEAETLISNVVFKRTHVDRDADLELGLFTNSAPGETIAHSAITEPTGTGYARITLTDASWSVTTGVASYAQQTFTGGAGGWTGSIQGYFINTKSSGGTKRLLAIEVDANGPYTINVGDTYKITPSITTA